MREHFHLHLFIIRSDGSSLRRLTNGPVYDLEASWRGGSV
jgi:hypothetical protein